MAEMYKLSLLLRGFSVDVARDGEEGIQRVMRGSLPDAVVLDLGLPRVDHEVPRKDGLDMISALRSLRLTQAVPVVVLSNDPASFEEAMDRGATECIANWRTTPRDLAGKLVHLLGHLDGA
jgi:CheY-like chemotaxis protein